MLRGAIDFGGFGIDLEEVGVAAPPLTAAPPLAVGVVAELLTADRVILLADAVRERDDVVRFDGAGGVAAAAVAGPPCDFF